jgi:Protein of unknown function (DUF3089)
LARKFLLVIAALIALLLAAGLVWSLFGNQLIRFAMVPRVAFTAPAPFPASRYASAQMWYARPDVAQGNPALWTPTGFRPDKERGNAAIFFIHPTSFLDPQPNAWNASLSDVATSDRAQIFIRGQASAFNGAGEIWAPRYRQAAFGAFLTTQPEAQRALDAAYADVSAAWDEFLREVGPDRPIIVAGHSQGSVHLLRLLRDRIAGQSVATRIVAAYVIGWPVSVTTDVPELGLPACERADRAGCILSWQSFAEPADPSQILAAVDATTGFTGQSRRGSPLLCTNPMTGTPNSNAPASANTGTIVPSYDLKTGTLEAGKIPARCDGRGILLIGPAPKDIGRYILPGNNYHVFDYSLFWSNIRTDAARRLAIFERK